MIEPIKHICFDFDGTLVEQGRGYYQAITDIFTKHSIEIPPRDLWVQAQWNDDFSLMHSYCDDKTIWFEITDLYCERYELNRVFDDVIPLLGDLTQSGVALTLATGRTISREKIIQIARELGIHQFFAEFITHGEVGGIKVVQAGDVDKSVLFDFVCDSVNVSKNESWYVTDIARDAHNAHAYGFHRVYGVTTGGINPALFNDDIFVITSVGDILNV